MSGEQSVTVWLARLKTGQHDAATEKLWQLYFSRLVRLAHARLGGMPRREPDAEDVALSAFASFVQAVDAGRFPRLDDRDDLWQVLLMLTSRKAAKLVRRETSAKRDSGQVQVLSALQGEGSQGGDRAQLPSGEPDPADAAAMAEECSRLLEMLGEPELRQVAVAKLEGYSNIEVAAQLGCSERTVERKLELIRQIWVEEGGIRTSAGG